MAALAGDVYELAVKQTYSGSTLMNVLHFQCLVSPTGTQAKFQTLADDIKEMLRVKQSSTLTWVSWRASKVVGDDVTYDPTTCNRSGGDFYEGNHSGTLTGADTSGAAGASFAAAVVALKTGQVGRSKRGQFFIGGLDTNSYSPSDRNTLAASYVTAWTTAIGTFTAKYLGTGGTDPTFKWVVFSRVIASGCKYVYVAGSKPQLMHVQDGNPDAAMFDVTSATLRSLIAPMNRRKSGRGI